MAVGVTALLQWTRNNVRMGQFIRETLAEFFAAFVLLIFAVGGTFSINEFGIDFVYRPAQAITYYAIGYFVITLIFGSISGAHGNPALSLAYAIVGKLSWIKIHAYVIAQFLGAYLGSLMTYGMFQSYMERTKVLATPVQSRVQLENMNGSAALFNSNRGHIAVGSGFLNEIILTWIFTCAVLAIHDFWNSRSPRYIRAILVGIVVYGLGVTFGATTGAQLNPFRDFAPRLAAITLGWTSDSVMKGADGRSQWWSVGLFGPFIGAIFGAFFYIFLIGPQVDLKGNTEDLPYRSKDDGPAPSMDGRPPQWRTTEFIPKVKPPPPPPPTMANPNHIHYR